MDTLFAVFLVALAISVICKALARKAQEKKEAELLERNPEAWKAVKVFELEKKDRSRKAGFGVAITIARILFGK